MTFNEKMNDLVYRLRVNGSIDEVNAATVIERLIDEREGNARQFLRLQERLAQAEADLKAYVDDATRYSRHLKGCWMDAESEPPFTPFSKWRESAVHEDDMWWDKEGPTIEAAIDDAIAEGK